MCEICELDDSYFSQIETMFRDVFNSPPWNDGWNDPLQLHEYICDMTRRRGSLVFGFFIDGKLCGAAIGCIRHWWSGTEYILDDFFICREAQGKGNGKLFMKGIEDSLKKKNIGAIYLQTEHGIPAYSFYRKTGFTELESCAVFLKILE